MFTGGCSQSGEMRIQRQFTELGTFHLEKGDQGEGRGNGADFRYLKGCMGRGTESGSVWRSDRE